MTNWEAGLDTHTHPAPSGGRPGRLPAQPWGRGGERRWAALPGGSGGFGGSAFKNSAEEAEIEGEQEKAAELETRGLRGGCNAGGGFGFYDGRNLGIFIDWEEELKRLKQRHRKKRAAL